MGIFSSLKRWFSTLNKSQKLRDIYDRIEENRNGGTTRNAVGELKQAREDLLEIVRNDDELLKFLHHYGVDPETLRDLYHALEEAGAAHFTHDGHYVAGSSIALTLPLDFVLRHRKVLLEDPNDRKSQRAAQRLVRYFENAEQGRIEDI